LSLGNVSRNVIRMNKLVLLLTLLMLSLLFSHSRFDWASVGAADGLPVHNLNTSLNYTTIQEAINDNETLDGHVILADAGTYFENVVVNKSLSIIGEDKSNTVINGSGIIPVYVTASNVSIRKFTVTNGYFGIQFEYSNNSLIAENNITNNNNAVLIRYSYNCTVTQNTVEHSIDRGIFITDSSNFTIDSNQVHGSGYYGINTNASTNGLIARNSAYQNYYDGIGLGMGSRNCTVIGNNASDNVLFGIWIDSNSENNTVYHNNIVRNTKQASVFLANDWDNGFEGNYWSDYAGNDSDQDGIGDTPYVIEEGFEDHYPLMGTFSSFSTSTAYPVNVISNSTVEGFVLFESNATIRMRVSNTTADPSFGFCRVSVPHAVMPGPYNATVGGVDPLYWNYTLFDDGISRWMYFNYEHSTREVVIRGVDIAPPIITVVAPENTTYAVNNVTLSFAVNEPTSWIGYSLDGQQNTTITGNTTLVALADGQHTLVICAQDITGNTGVSGTVYFSVEVPQPEQFPWWLIITVVAVIGVMAAVLILYRAKSKKKK
jgi:parallel beta-helix repeat protein